MPNALRFLAFIAGLAGAIQPATAQRARTSRVGLKLGGSLAQYRGEDTRGGSGNLGGYCGGALLHLPVSPVFSVQPEFLYSQKGARSQSFILPSNMATVGNQRLAYLEVPVLAKLRSRTGLFAEAGPTLSYLLSARAETSGQNSSDNRFNFKDLEAGYAVGAGFQAAKGFLMGVCYTRGLTSIFKAGAYQGIKGEPDIYNQTFQLYAGLIFFGRPEPEFPR